MDDRAVTGVKGVCIAEIFSILIAGQKVNSGIVRQTLARSTGSA